MRLPWVPGLLPLIPTINLRIISVAEPIVLELETEEHTEAYITILDAEGGELVTVVEFLSPTNKLAGPGREEYCRKRDDLAKARVNLVEIDLIRQGSWRELLRPLVARHLARMGVRARVGSNQFVYWKQYSPTSSVGA